MPTMTIKGMNDNAMIIAINNSILNFNYSRATTSNVIINDKLNIKLGTNNNLSNILQNINLPPNSITINNINDTIIVFD